MLSSLKQSINFSTITLGIFGGTLVLTLLFRLISQRPKRKYLFLTSPGRWISDVWAYASNGNALLQSRYLQCTEGFFEVATLRRRLIVLRSEHYIQELLNAPKDKISFFAWSKQTLQTDYMFPGYMPGHIWPRITQQSASILSGPITRNLGRDLPDIAEEIRLALSEEVASGRERDHGWIEVPLQSTFYPVVARALNRILIGKSASRERKYIDALASHGPKLAMYAFFVSIFPRVLRPYIGRYLRNRLNDYERTIAGHLRPEIQRRLSNFSDTCCDDEPTDFLQMHIKKMANKPNPCTIEELIRELIFVNFSALPNTTFALTAAVLDLVRNPEYILSLQKEISSVIQLGRKWSTDVISELYHLDSFMKESQRIHPQMAVGIPRIANQEYQLGDKIHVRKGDYVAVPAGAMCQDPVYYPAPESFDGFRFSKLKDLGQEDYRFTDTNGKIFAFGAGRHSCLGRFIVDAINKIILAELLTGYEIDMVEGSEKEPHSVQTFEEHSLPNLRCSILVCKRVQ